MRLQAPCKDCPDREVGCHSVCEKYIEFKRLNKIEHDKAIEKMKQEQILNDIEKTRIRKAATGAFWRSRK